MFGRNLRGNPQHLVVVAVRIDFDEIDYMVTAAQEECVEGCAPIGTGDVPVFVVEPPCKG